jgi:GntR family transcriptional regulator of arabinose operon
MDKEWTRLDKGKRQGVGAFVCYSNGSHLVSGSIDVLLDVTYTYFSSHYIKSISEVLAQKNYQFVIHDTRDSQQDIAYILNCILKKGSTGIIIQPPRKVEPLHPELRELFIRLGTNSIPYVMLDHAFEGFPGVQVVFDNYQGGRIAAEYLVSLGHKNCAMVCNSMFYENQSRLDGFNSVLLEKKLPPLYAIEMDHNLEQKLLSAIKEHSVTAIFNYNDETALETMRILHNAGIRVPEDVSVVGFDDTFIATATNPQLTTVIHPKDALGRMAVEKLISLVTQSNLTLDPELLLPRMHIRASCAPPRQV